VTLELSSLIRNNVRDKLARGEVVASMIVRLVGGAEIARIAHTAGFDTFYVDMEHSTLSVADVGRICMEALAAGITPLVRVPDLSHVQRVVDAGALGIIVPHVRSAKEARDAVLAIKYPPLGSRGYSSLLPQLQFRSFPSSDAQQAVNDATIVVVMMEDIEALDAVEESGMGRS
jgi:4-hydroxy-2-oxoheptanedioate aldolase